MATIAEKLSLNVSGRFYVDSTCIDCDQCRTLAPENFGRDEENGSSYVKRQPVTAEELAATEEARAGCPTESIGADGD